MTRWITATEAVVAGIASRWSLNHWARENYVPWRWVDGPRGRRQRAFDEVALRAFVPDRPRSGQRRGIPLLTHPALVEEVEFLRVGGWRAESIVHHLARAYDLSPTTVRTRMQAAGLYVGEGVAA